MRYLWKPLLPSLSVEPIERGRCLHFVFVRYFVLTAFTLLQLACGQPSTPPTVNSPGAAATTPGVPPAEDGQWPMAAKNYESTRYCGLDEINASNVAGLKVAWTFSTGVNRGQEAAPIVVGDTMYVVTPYPNILYALDLKNNGNVKWKYEPNPESASQGVACCDTVNRGAVYSNGRVFINTLDGQTCAVDAATGKEIWKTKLGNINIGETITMAPIVVNNKVLVGNSGGEFGVRGWLAAVDANSGQLAWKAYSTGPDSDVLIGPNFRPFYDTDKGKDLGVHTWPPEQWKIGGGNVWGWISYDPASNLIFYGTGISNAAVAWIIHAVALWVWHVPAMFQATLRSDFIHTLQHASFFGTALLFWWAVLFGKRGLQSYGAGVLYLFTTMVQSGLLGIFLTLTSRVWYPAYSAATELFGLSPIEDQQIGGLIMWIPAGLVYMFAALVMFSGWLRESEKRVVDRETRMKTQITAAQ